VTRAGWDYALRVVEGRDERDIADALREMDADGWELVSVTDVVERTLGAFMGAGSISAGFLCVFRRATQEGSDGQGDSE
jgi:hypothetical protein